MEGEKTMFDETEMKRLRWRCTHRSMLEMDILLGNFLDRHFSNLPAPEQAAFAALAEMEDIELRPLVMGRQECDDPLRAKLIALMRQAGGS